MSERLIIENRSGYKMEDALGLVQSVVGKGRISNDGKKYCYLTVFKMESGDVRVSAFKNKASDRLVIW